MAGETDPHVVPFLPHRPRVADQTPGPLVELVDHGSVALQGDLPPDPDEVLGGQLEAVGRADRVGIHEGK